MGNTTAIQTASAALQALKNQREQKKSVKEATSADKKLLHASRYYGTTNEMLRDMFSGTKNYNSDMFNEASRRGELDIYFALLDLNKDNVLSDEFYSPAYYDYDRLMAELYLVNADDTDESLIDRTIQEYNSKTGKYEEVSVGKMTDREYLKYTIDRSKEYRTQELEYDLQEYQKEAESGWTKFLHTVGQLDAEFGEGVIKTGAGLLDVFGALGYSIYRAAVTQGQELFTDSFTNYFGEGHSLIGAWSESVGAELDEWERTHGWIMNYDGSTTSVGGALASISNSFGMMLPSILIGTISGGAAIPIVASGKLVGQLPLAFTSFYASMFSNNMYENAMNDTLENAPSAMLILNSALKSTSQAVIEWGLGKILGGTVGNTLMGLGSGLAKGGAAITKKAVAGYIFKSAAQEGLEEFLQDMGDMFIDTAFSWAQDGFTAGVDFQQLLDSFIVGAVSSLLLSGFSVGSMEIRSTITKGDNNFDIFYTKDGETKKVRGFSRLYWHEILNQYQESVEAVLEGRLSEKKTVKVLTNLGKTYKVLGEFFDGITSERIANAMKLFSQFTNTDFAREQKAQKLARLAQELDGITPDLGKAREAVAEDVIEEKNKAKIAYVNQLYGDVMTMLDEAKTKGIEQAKSKVKSVIEENAEKLAEAGTTEITRTIDNKGETVGVNTESNIVAEKQKARKEKQSDADQKVKSIWDKSRKTAEVLASRYQFIFTTDGHVALEAGQYLFVPESWLENFSAAQIIEFVSQAEVIKQMRADKTWAPILEAIISSYKTFTGVDLRKGSIKGVERALMDTLFNEAVFQNFLLQNIHKFVDKDTKQNLLFKLADLFRDLSNNYAKKDTLRQKMLAKIYDKIKQTMRVPVLKACINWGLDPQIAGVANGILNPTDLKYINQYKAHKMVVLGENTSRYYHVRDEILNRANPPQFVRDAIEKGSRPEASKAEQLTAHLLLDILDMRMNDAIDNANIRRNVLAFGAQNLMRLSSELLKTHPDYGIAEEIFDRGVVNYLSNIDTAAYDNEISDLQSRLWYFFRDTRNKNKLTDILIDISRLRDELLNEVTQLEQRTFTGDYNKHVFPIPVSAFNLVNQSEIQHYADVANDFQSKFGVEPENYEHIDWSIVDRSYIGNLNIADPIAVKDFVIDWLENQLGDGYVVFRTEQGFVPTKVLTADRVFRLEVLQGNLAAFLNVNGETLLYNILSDEMRKLIGNHAFSYTIFVGPQNTSGGATDYNTNTPHKGTITINSFDIRTLYHEVVHALSAYFLLPNGGNAYFADIVDLHDEILTNLKPCVQYYLWRDNIDLDISNINTYSDTRTISNIGVQIKLTNILRYIAYIALENEMWARAYSHNKNVPNGYTVSVDEKSIRSPLSGEVFDTIVNFGDPVSKWSIDEPMPTTSAPSETYQDNMVERYFLEAINSHDNRYLDERTDTNYHTAFTGNTNDLLSDIMSPSVPDAVKSLVTIDMIIKRPQDYLSQDLYNQIKDKSEGGVYRFLQEFFYKHSNYNIDRSSIGDHPYIFVDDNSYDDLLSDEAYIASVEDGDYDFVEKYNGKTVSISEFFRPEIYEELNIPTDVPVTIGQDVKYTETKFDKDHQNGIITIRVDSFTTNAELINKITHEFRHVLQHYNRLESGFTNDFKASTQLIKDLKKYYPSIFTNKIIRERFKTDERIANQFVYFMIGGEQNAFAFNYDMLVGKPWFATYEAGKGKLFAPWYDGKNGVYEVELAARSDADNISQKPKTTEQTTEEITEKKTDEIIKPKGIPFPTNIRSRSKQISILVANNWAISGQQELDEKLDIILDNKYSKRYRTQNFNALENDYRELLEMFYSFRLQMKSDTNITTQEDVDFHVKEDMEKFDKALKELIKKGKNSKSAYTKFRQEAVHIYTMVWSESYKTYSDEEIQRAYDSAEQKAVEKVKRGLNAGAMPKIQKKQHKWVSRKIVGKDKAGNDKTIPVYTKKGWYLNKERANRMINGQKSNLSYYYHRGQTTQMRPEMQDFIEATTGNESKLPRALVLLIKGGKLTYEQTITWFRKAEQSEINDYTFDLLNKYFFKNDKITDIQQLDTILTSDIRYWYAIPKALLREGAGLEWLARENSLEGFMKFLEQAKDSSFKNATEAIVNNMNFDRFNLNLKEAQTYLRPMVMQNFDGTLGSAMHTAAMYIGFLSYYAKAKFGVAQLDKSNKGTNKTAGHGGESAETGSLGDLQKSKTSTEQEIDALYQIGSRSEIASSLAMSGKEVQSKKDMASRLARNKYKTSNRAKEIDAVFSAMQNINNLSKMSAEERQILAKLLATITKNDEFNTSSQPFSKAELLKVLTAFLKSPALLNKEGSKKALDIFRTRLKNKLNDLVLAELDKSTEMRIALTELGQEDLTKDVLELESNATETGIEQRAESVEALASQISENYEMNFNKYFDSNRLTVDEWNDYKYLVEQIMYENQRLKYLAMSDEEIAARNAMLETSEYAPDSIQELYQQEATDDSPIKTTTTSTQTRIKSLGTQIANMVVNKQIDFDLLPKEVQDLFEVTEVGTKSKSDIRIKLKESAYKLNPIFNATKEVDKKKARLNSVNRINENKNLLQDTLNAAKKDAYLKNKNSETIRKIQARAQKQLKAQKEKFARAEAGLRETIFEYKKKDAPKESTPRQRNLAQKTDITVTVGSKVDLPEKLKSLFATGFTTLADTEVQFASQDTDGKLYEKGSKEFESRKQHEVLTWETFYEANREILRDLTHDEVIDIVDAIQQGIYSFGDLDAQRKVLAFQIFVLGYIYDGSRGNQMLWNLSTAEAESIRQTYEQLASIAGTALNAVGQMISTVNPVKTVMQRLFDDYGISEEDTLPLFTAIEELFAAADKKDVEAAEKAGKVFEREAGRIDGLMAKHQAEEAAKKYKVKKAEQKALLEKYRGDVQAYKIRHKDWVARKLRGEKNIGAEPIYPKKPRALKQHITETQFYKTLSNWRFMSMLSNPATWVRNIVSNIMVVTINKAADAVGNAVFKIAGKGAYRADQWNLSSQTKVSAEVDTYVENLINSMNYVIEERDAKGNLTGKKKTQNLFDILYETTSKYSDRMRLKTGADLFSALVASAIEERYAATHRFNSVALNRINNFISTRIKDTRFIKYATNKYFKRILQIEVNKGHIDLSKPISRNVLDLFAEAVILGSQDFMHKESALGAIMSTWKKEHPNAYFVGNLMFPFINVSFNWFVEGFKLSPFGLIKAIYNSAHLEEMIDKVDAKRAEGAVLPSTKALEYLTRRDVGKGIIGTILWGVGALFGALGFLKIDEEDDKVYLYVFGDVKIDISDIFGSSSLLIGAAIFGTSRLDDATLDDVLGQVFNLLLDGFIGKDLWENERWHTSMYEWLLSYTESFMKSFFPQILQLFVRATNNKEIQYGSGTIGALQRLLNSFIPTQPLGDRKVNPYTGEEETKYAIPFVGEILRSGALGLRITWHNVSEGEKLVREYEVKKGMIEPQITIDGEEVNIGDKMTLNKYYGKLNDTSLSELQNKSHLVEMTDGSYKTLPWSQMDFDQRQNVIERTFTKNATYAKIYMWTQVQKHKYYTNAETRRVLQELGITSNVYLGDKGFVE